jgi:hypothetical protein
MRSRPTHHPSLWHRFWSPTGLLETVPPEASAEEGEAIRQRNDIWLRTYMDMYILRWGLLWAATAVLAVLAAGDALPGLLFTLALLATGGAFIGLAAMVLTYRRAVRSMAARASRRP